MRMTIEEIIAKEKEIAVSFHNTVDTHMVNSNLSLEEMYCDDTEVIEEELKRCKELPDYHNTIANIMRKYQQLEDFARWVAVEVIDEEMWTYNHLSFAEIACRKLVQLGVMQESDGEYTYEVVEDGNNK